MNKHFRESPEICISELNIFNLVTLSNMEYINKIRNMNLSIIRGIMKMTSAGFTFINTCSVLKYISAIIALLLVLPYFAVKSS